MVIRYFYTGVLVLGICVSVWAMGGVVTYKLDGKAFSFKNGKIEYHKADGYITLTAERTSTIVDPSGPEGEKREVLEGMSIQLAKPENEIAGEHKSSTPDEMPTHFSWYRIVPAEDGKGKRIREYLATMDNGDETKMFIRLKINSFGKNGSMVQGTFSGKIFDEDGKPHEVADGYFSVPREDVE